MVLEEKVVLVRGTTDAPEDVALHEVIRIRTEPINNLAES